MNKPLRGLGAWAASLLAVAASVLAAAALAQAPAPARQQPTSATRADLKTLDYRLQARNLGPGVWVVEGDNDDFSLANGCNIINTGFIATGGGVLVINTGPSRRYGEQLRALIAKTSPEPVIGVLHLNLHPDYFLGNQAFADVPRYATATTRSGMASEAAAYETNLYRLCGEWMKGTETLLPDKTLQVPADGLWKLGNRSFRVTELNGHTPSDLVLQDLQTQISFAGGLVFAQRVPTTPHADVPAWQASLRAMAVTAGAATVPSHGPVHSDGSGLAQTAQYLRWLDQAFKQHAQLGLDMNEVLRAPVPAEFKRWAAFETEFVRNVAHLYPRYERAALQPLPASPLRQSQR